MPNMQPLNSTMLTRGVNLRSLAESINMREGEASDCLDVLPRHDGAIHKTFGWHRINDTALTGRVVGVRGFTYRGKNVDTGSGNTARPGNFGLADDGAVFTRRGDEFSSLVVLTTSTFYFWNPSTEVFETVALPGGVSVLADPKPTFLVLKENVYIVNWADVNLRFDPTDRALYPWGWEVAQIPAAPSLAAAAGGTLVPGVYQYAYTYFDVYTGEETTLGALGSVTTTSANATVNVTSLANYGGSRHFNDAAVATDRDVGIVIYRTLHDRDEFFFLTTLDPGTTSYTDTGDAVDTSLKPWRGTMEDEPPFTSMEEFQARIYAIARGTDSNRLYRSAFTDAAFFERWEVRGYKDLPVPEGDELTAAGKTDTSVLAFTRKGCFRCTIVETAATVDIIPRRLPWSVGCIGPRARLTVESWEYFLSDRGPYRWREGLSQPQWIGEYLAPLFIDPTSGACRLSEASRSLSEVGLDWLGNTVRFVFPIGDALAPNTHMAYWIDAEAYNGDYRAGWFPQSPKIQAMDLSHSIEKLDDTGRPVTGNERLERLVFGDQNGYVYEYDLTAMRGGLKPGAGSVFTVSGGTVSSISIDDDPLYTNGDGLTGLRIELVSSVGVVKATREVESNTSSAVVPTVDLDEAPVEGDILLVGGIPAYWRSWVDHMGSFHTRKTLMWVHLSYQRTGSVALPAAFRDEIAWKLDVSVAAGRFPRSVSRSYRAALSDHRAKLIVSQTAHSFTYEVANSRPDERFTLTSILREFVAVIEKTTA
jgi:hypothetical protein